MDLDNLKQQWKEDESMHPPIEFNPKQFQKELTGRVNAVKSLWLWALFSMAIFLVSIIDATFTTERYVKITISVVTAIYLVRGYVTFRPKLNPDNLNSGTVLRGYRFAQKHAGVLCIAYLAMIMTDLIYLEQSVGGWFTDNFEFGVCSLLTIGVFLDFYYRRSKLEKLTPGKEKWYQYFVERSNKGRQRTVIYFLILIPGLALLLGGLYYWDYMPLGMAVSAFLGVTIGTIPIWWGIIKRNNELNRDQ